VTKLEQASDMINSTVATLECAAQVRVAATMTHNTGSAVMAENKGRLVGAFSAGAKLSIKM
jgi:hypothetical protein